MSCIKYIQCSALKVSNPLYLAYRLVFIYELIVVGATNNFHDAMFVNVELKKNLQNGLRVIILS